MESSLWKKLRAPERSLFLTLWERAGRAEPGQAGEYLLSCWPSVRWLANREGVTQSTIFRRLKKLEAAGLVVRANRGGWVGKHNVYTLFVPAELVATNLAEHRIKRQPPPSPVRDSTSQECEVYDRKTARLNSAKTRHSLNLTNEPDQLNLSTTTNEGRGGGGGGDSGGVIGTDQDAESVELLRAAGVGMPERKIRALLAEHDLTPRQVAAVIFVVNGFEGVRQPAAVIVSRLRDSSLIAADCKAFDLAQQAEATRKHAEQEAKRRQQRRDAIAIPIAEAITAAKRAAESASQSEQKRHEINLANIRQAWPVYRLTTRDIAERIAELIDAGADDELRQAVEESSGCDLFERIAKRAAACIAAKYAAHAAARGAA